LFSTDHESEGGPEMTSTIATLTGERADLLKILTTRRHFLRHTAQNLTDEQAALTPTASALSVAGLIKHVAAVEYAWQRFAVGGAEAMNAASTPPEDWADGFRMTEGETLRGLLDRYAEVAATTDELVATLDLDTSYPLPEAPWFEPGASWSVRQVLLHLVGETAQHAGHADIIRETIDGQKSMG
jgi:uncharacterized damage-inducible protein DinB